ncbi:MULTISPECIES: TetR-like C-terminal domain-containing protein [unclassified Rathayibacter]|uniref:TetR-like C-terminal domain-containing protein n=1 Tax=unclassified Rathayibacter TaxID=2609250 RepID=UPI0007009ACD|nr:MULTISPECIES: TetR-like C-terminal domain-containing protein [unclassified Rathayibacter]KQP95957.1 TetR family transcriptional regulator [Rathayibacter sp. Leaf294]KQS07678.1 TetR family transcriptional regulator [Rathayibacter sp. Leaf185]
MARLRTQTLVQAAALDLARTGTLSMEGIAARAGVSKQTLYRTWPSTGAILFDALLARSLDASGRVVVPDTGDLAADLELLVTGTIAELTDPDQEPLLRSLTAAIQTDAALAEQYRERLLAPQLAAVAERLRHGGVTDADEAAELLLGAVLHRWLLRSRPFEPGWPGAHVRRVLRAL